MLQITLMLLSEWREFPSASCLAEKENLTARVSVLLKSRASPDMLPFSLCNKKKTCNSAQEQTPLSNDTIDYVLGPREVRRGKDLSPPPRNYYKCCFILSVDDHCIRSVEPTVVPVMIDLSQLKIMSADSSYGSGLCLQYGGIFLSDG